MLTKDYSEAPEALHGRCLYAGPQEVLINGQVREVQTYYKTDKNGRAYRAGEREVRTHVKTNEVRTIRISREQAPAAHALRMATAEELAWKARKGRREPNYENRLLRALFGR